jgi:hypothetical protein
MDDLFLAVLRRRADDDLSRFERAISTDGSLHQLWRLNVDSRRAAFTIEFVALANHRKAIRAELARYAERFRATQLRAVAAGLADAGVGDGRLPPIAGLLVMTGLSQVLALERALGVTTGHDATIEFVESSIASLEGGHDRRSGGRRRRESELARAAPAASSAP